jgi:hypothetical protein
MMDCCLSFRLAEITFRMVGVEAPYVRQIARGANGSIRYPHRLTDTFLTLDSSLVSHLFSPAPQKLIGVPVIYCRQLVLCSQFPCLPARSEDTCVPGTHSLALQYEWRFGCLGRQ